MSNPDLTGNLKSLPEALRALPQLAPAQSAWPQLAAQLAAQGLVHPAPVAPASSAQRGRIARWVGAAAFAAGITLAIFAWPLLRHGSPAVATATVQPSAASLVTNAANSTNATSTQRAADPADASVQLAALHQRSQALEHWLGETARAAAPLPGQDLAAAAEIEDMIGLVDGQLNTAPRDSELALWRRRVALLEDLTALRYSSYSLAETGISAKSLSPTTWNN